MKNMTVNHLPVLTWNKLKMNEVTVFVVDGKEGGAWPEVAESPEEELIACKQPMYREQAFPTGLGAEMDEYAGAVEVLEINESSDTPIVRKYTAEDGADLRTALYIHVKKGVEASLAQIFDGEGSGQAAASVKVYLEDDAKFHLIRVQKLPKAYTFLDDCGFRLMRRAQMEYTSVQQGAGTVYAGAYADQWGAESEFRADVAYVGDADSVLDFNYVDTFRGRKSKGLMRFEGVLKDNARKIMRDTLDFRREAVDAEGDEEENVLTLGSDMINRAIPMILGEEEKVSGRHAHTSGKLSPEMLFYMESRGIDAAEAEQLMIEAKLKRVTDRIPEGIL